MDPVEQEIFISRLKHINKVVWAIVAAVAVIAAGLWLGKAASATEDPQPILVESECFQEWYVNPDEGDRLPEQIEAGLLFQPADLVHHVAGFPLDDLGTGGTFTVNPSPGENFRFSVEIINADKTGYATLHWNPLTDKWFIGGADASLDQYTNEEADPETFIGKLGRFGEIKADSVVMSFGVGYTKNPPGTIDTVVSSVTFAGVTYDLACALEPEPTATASSSPSPVVITTTTAPATTAATATTTAPATTTASLTTSATATTATIGLVGALPVTGPNTTMKVFLVLGILLLGLGVFLLVGLWLRNRQARG